MKHLLIIGVLVFSFSSFSQNQLDIEQLAHNSCWFSAEEDSINIASFNDGTSHKLGAHEFGQVYEEYESQLQKFNLSLKGRDFELFIHCGGYGSSLVINFQGEDEGVCFWNQITKDNRINMAHLGYMYPNSKGFCHGMRPGKLIGLIKDPNSKAGTLNEIQKGPLGQFIKEMRSIGSRTIVFDLNEEYRFQIKKVIEEFQELIGDDGPFKSIEPDNYYHPVGEFKKINLKEYRINF
jgi:hypothetical protein